MINPLRELSFQDIPLGGVDPRGQDVLIGLKKSTDDLQNRLNLFSFPVDHLGKAAAPPAIEIDIGPGAPRHMFIVHRKPLSSIVSRPNPV